MNVASKSACRWSPLRIASPLELRAFRACPNISVRVGLGFVCPHRRKSHGGRGAIHDLQGSISHPLLSAISSAFLQTAAQGHALAPPSSRSEFPPPPPPPPPSLSIPPTPPTLPHSACSSSSSTSTTIRLTRGAQSQSCVPPAPRLVLVRHGSPFSLCLFRGGHGHRSAREQRRALLRPPRLHSRFGSWNGLLDLRLCESVDALFRSQ